MTRRGPVTRACLGSDHVIPARWVTDIHRDWNQRYVWPRFVTAVPREFFDAVRAFRETDPAASRVQYILRARNRKSKIAP